jgi:tRNA pseudouridine55 synthase
MTGVLLIDKPSGPTSHDVVARLRHVTRERSIGHAGTLDPRATGLLVLLLGKATRLASLLSGHDKVYDATIRLGWATTTDDADGQRLDTLSGPLPDDEGLRAALGEFRGTFDQMPPQYSAKKIGGHKAYDLARRDQHAPLTPASVTVRHLDTVERVDDLVRLRLAVTAGFYVRSLARDLGERLGCGAHLADLRRTHSGIFDVSTATPLEEAERLGPEMATRLIPPAEALPELPAVHLSDSGLVRARHGNPIGPQFVAGPWVPAGLGQARVRLLDPAGTLVALADLRGGLLHPAVVLG